MQAVSAGLSATSSIMSGRAQARSFANEAKQYDVQAKGVDLQSLQTSERRREELRANLSAITASRAAKGLSLDSPTGVAIEKELRRQAVRDEGAERVGFLNQAGALRMAAKAKRRGASSANLIGYLAAGQTLIGASQDMAAAFSGAPGGSGGKK